jgi:hypothetical protein
LNDHGTGLLREPLGDGARPLVEGTAELNLYQLACAEGIVERPDEGRRDALRADVHERIEVVGFRAKLSALLPGYRHVVFVRRPRNLGDQSNEPSSCNMQRRPT